MNINRCPKAAKINKGGLMNKLFIFYWLRHTNCFIFSVYWLMYRTILMFITDFCTWYARRCLCSRQLHIIIGMYLIQVEMLLPKVIRMIVIKIVWSMLLLWHIFLLLLNCKMSLYVQQFDSSHTILINSSAAGREILIT